MRNNLISTASILPEENFITKTGLAGEYIRGYESISYSYKMNYFTLKNSTVYEWDLDKKKVDFLNA
jgi:hypothetical protein